MSPDNLIDVLNDDGTTTGKVLPMRQVHEQSLWHAAAHAWIYSDTGKVLVQKRAMTKGNLPGEWDVSAAGHVDAGETILQAMKRELKEELGVDAEESQFEPVGMIVSHQMYEKYQCEHREFWHVFFLELPETTTCNFNDGEVEEVRWLSFDEFIKLKSKTGFVTTPAYRKLVIGELKKRIG